MTKIAGIVLAGGKSSRMGTDKSFLTINKQTLLERSEQLLVSSNVDSVFISGKQGIKDLLVEKGPLGGIFSCLAKLTEYNYLLFIPVDMPMLTTQIINHIIEKNKKDISLLKGYNFPLILKNDGQVRENINTQIANNYLSLYQLFEKLDANVIEHNYDAKYFINTNSPEHWQTIKNLLQQPKR